jgi:hypothetical protein
MKADAESVSLLHTNYSAIRERGENVDAITHAFNNGSSNKRCREWAIRNRRRVYFHLE